MGFSLSFFQLCHPLFDSGDNNRIGLNVGCGLPVLNHISDG